jgi:hypothetical protein
LISRFAELFADELASAVDLPNSGEFSVPTGAARFTTLKTFCISAPISR